MACPGCGADVAATAQFCQKCGTNLSGSASAAVNQQAGPGDGVYAGFWRRLGAHVIDGVIMYGGIFALGSVAGLAGLGEVPAGVGGLIAAWLYNAIMESSSRQATVGKLALGIKVTDYAGHRIGFGRATGRYFGQFLSALTVGIGFVMAGFTRRRQALHDMIAGTLVVKKETSNEVVAAGPLAGPVPAWSMVLLVLVGTAPFLLGVLGAIAIPAYQDYLVRAQIVEGLKEASAYKAAVTQAAAAGSGWEEIDSEALELPTAVQSKYVESIEVGGGAVQITYGREASRPISGAMVALVPGRNEEGEIVWICGLAAAPDSVEPAIDEHADYTSVEPRFLPASCRPGWQLQ